MKKLIAIFLLTLCVSSYSQDVTAANNSIKMGYNFVTVSQTVVFNSAMQAGGTLQLSASIADGGGRNPGDPITLKLVFYNSSNQVVSTVQQAYTMTLGAAAATYSVTATNCGSSCSNVTYVSVEFYGKDGGYWAGNYGPLITTPILSFNGGGNILYNPEFGVYGTNGYAQGWTSSNGWQSCALYSGAQTCVVNNGAPVNGGTYSATGGTTSGSSGGYTAQPAAPTYPSYMTVGSTGSYNPITYGTSSNITNAQQTRVTAFTNKTINNNGIYIDQVGNNNNIVVDQAGSKNLITGIGQQDAKIQGSFNNITLRQGVSGDVNKNEIDLRVVGDTNTLNLNQARTTQGIAIGTNGHYLSTDIYGNSNTLTTQQSNVGGVGGHYMETTITGNTNNVIVKQTDNGNKIMFVTVNGSSNTVDAVQKDSGQHYLDLKLTGNNHSVSSVQQGNTQNKATIELINGGGGAAIDIIQNGGANYNITTTCVTAGGCGTITVRQ